MSTITKESSTSSQVTTAAAYVHSVYESVIARNPNESEFHQAVKILDSLIPVIEAHPKYRNHSLLEQLVEPERVITFRVPWVDDQGKVR